LLLLCFKIYSNYRRWGLGPYAAKKKQLIAEGKLDKYGRPNENTPAEYLRALPDLQQQQKPAAAAAAEAATPAKEDKPQQEEAATPAADGEAKSEKKKKKKDKVSAVLAAARVGALISCCAYSESCGCS
jgi:H/ACA ribonucleoprotein complex subunit 4